MAENEKGKKFLTPVFRVSYPKVWKAAKVNENDPKEKAKFSLTMIYEKAPKDPTEQQLLAVLQAAVRAVGEKKWGPDRNLWPKKREEVNSQIVEVSAVASPWKDGAIKEGKAGYGKDFVYANASSEIKPGIIGLNRVINPVTGKEEFETITDPQKFYAGCYARAFVTVYAYDFESKKKGVSFGLRGIQFIRDGEPLGGKDDPQQDFDAVTPREGPKPLAAAAAVPAGGGFGV